MGTFIPAYTGQLPRPVITACGCTFHPRIHGETAALHHVHPATRPFIPAYTGKPPCHCSLPFSQYFHPRIHGGNAVYQQTSCTLDLSSPHTRGELSGSTDPSLTFLSSPHTRGEPTHRRRSCRCSAFIPAYTGGTAMRKVWISTWTFHPRIHGGNVIAVCVSATLSLSSPHTRGEQ